MCRATRFLPFLLPGLAAYGCIVLPTIERPEGTAIYSDFCRVENDQFRGTMIVLHAGPMGEALTYRDENQEFWSRDETTGIVIDRAAGRLGFTVPERTTMFRDSGDVTLTTPAARFDGAITPERIILTAEAGKPIHRELPLHTSFPWAPPSCAPGKGTGQPVPN
jgi:hypothetical protein